VTYEQLGSGDMPLRNWVQVVLGLVLILISSYFLSSIGTDFTIEGSNTKLDIEFLAGCVGVACVITCVLLEISALHKTRKALDNNPMLKIRVAKSTRKFGHEHITDELAGASGLV